MEKKVLLAVTLSIIVILVYPMILAKINPDLANPTQKTQVFQKQEVIEKTIDTGIKETEPVSNLPSNAVTKSLSTDMYELDITDTNGSISRILVKDVERMSDVLLVSKAALSAGLLAIDGKGILTVSSSQLYTIHSDKRTVSLDSKDIKIEKNISFLNDRYGFDTVIKLTNKTFQAQNLAFDITTASNISKKEMFETRYIELAIHYKDGSVKKLTGKKLLTQDKLYKNNIDWIALKNKYYAIIAKPDFDAKGVFTKNVSGEPVLGFIVEDDKIAAGETKAYKINFYVGPIEIKELEKIDPGFTKALNFGFLTSISLILLSILQFFYSIFHNYGVAILLLTVCMNLCLYPLTFKSLKSMQKLQELQPHIEKIRQENKDNPTRLNKEIMELYKKYSVNPMSGCLPMVLQMPVFIALYNALSRSVALKNATFLWIKDLSMPDAFFRLGSSIPLLGDSINLLPILMIGAMILQQKISQSTTGSSQSEQQKLIANIMPVMFGFIFYSLPSGLVLYWLTSTLVTSTMQFFMFKKAANV
ncbi:MAG: membrane protein insertase YidC [Candidatus Omnitrophica bacterium]|nr:membrane protein insertase YidC [Candidatus Omnitrophota bacterium]